MSSLSSSYNSLKIFTSKLLHFSVWLTWVHWAWPLAEVCWRAGCWGGQRWKFKKECSKDVVSFPVWSLPMEEIATDSQPKKINFQGLMTRTPEGNSAENGKYAAESNHNPFPVSLVWLRWKKLLKENFSNYLKGEALFHCKHSVYSCFGKFSKKVSSTGEVFGETAIPPLSLLQVGQQMIPNFTTKPNFLSSGKVFTQQMILTFWHITTSLFFATKSDSVSSWKFFIKKNFFILSPLQGQIQELQCDFLCNRVDIEFSSPPIITRRYK